MNAKKERKAQTHETILESASRLLRTRGIAGASVAEVMKGAGLTVGGFYAHFASKEALVDATLARTGAAMRERLFAPVAGAPASARTILGRYLSARHRDAGEQGCPLPAVVGEVGTTAGAHRDALARELEAIASELAAHVAPAARPRQIALGLAALMIGGLSLSRALRGTPLSDEVLGACRALGGLAVRAATDAATGVAHEVDEA